jgi:hypothetical protein
MGQLPPSAFDPLRAAAEAAVAGALARGEYVGWLLTPKESRAGWSRVQGCSRAMSCRIR